MENPLRPTSTASSRPEMFTKENIFSGLVLAILVGIGSAGISTRDIALENDREIARLIEKHKERTDWMQKQIDELDCCTLSECAHVQRDMMKLTDDFESHEREPAHREAHLRMQNLELWQAQVNEWVLPDRPPALGQPVNGMH